MRQCSMAVMTNIATPKGTVPMAEVLCGVHRVTAMVAFKCGWVGDHLSIEADFMTALRGRRQGKGAIKVWSYPDY